MANKSEKMLSVLRTVDLKMAAFELNRTFSGGVYPNAIVQAVQLFNCLPCAETASVLISVCPEAYQVMALSTGSLAANAPKAIRSPYYDGLDEWMESFDTNEKSNNTIHSFLLNGTEAGQIQVGFHRLRDQEVLFRRLGLIGLRKGWFVNSRQYLRDTITRNISAFRVVTDLVCIHGVSEGREVYWNSLGAEEGQEFYLRSEVQYALRGRVDEFIRVAAAMQSAD